jgi:hypothetical protein
MFGALDVWEAGDSGGRLPGLLPAQPQKTIAISTKITEACFDIYFPLVRIVKTNLGSILSMNNGLLFDSLRFR